MTRSDGYYWGLCWGEIAVVMAASTALGWIFLQNQRGVTEGTVFIVQRNPVHDEHDGWSTAGSLLLSGLCFSSPQRS